MKSQQDLFDLVAGLLDLGMDFEAVAEVPRLVVKVRVVLWEEFNHAVPQNEIVMIAFAWQPALGLWRIIASSSWHDSITLCGRHYLVL